MPTASRRFPSHNVRVVLLETLYSLRWGPTKVPIYNLLLLSTTIWPHLHSKHVSIVHWLIVDANVSVEGTDVSGTTALAHSISTKPSFDPVFAQLLYDAGADVNHCNRYGDVPANEICMVWDPKNIPRAAEALAWFLAHGGNADIKDNDGMVIRVMVQTVAKKWGDKTLKGVVEAEDARRRQRGPQCCAFCGREDVKVMVCSRCKKVGYCCPPRVCQQRDWKQHKEGCKA